MIKEIGSEFWNIPISKKINKNIENIKWFESGRSALMFILDNINIKSISIPSYCCDSMIKPFINKKININFYPVFLENNILKQELDLNSDAILLIDYFGFDNKINLKDYKGIIIRDLTHSVFIKEYTDADYYFGSLRKWCGFKTGGFAYSKSNELKQEDYKVDHNYINLRVQAMFEKEKYIKNEIDTKDYLNYFVNAEKMLDDKTNIYNAYIEDIKLIKKLDIDFIKKCRRNNAKIILSYFSDISLFKELNEDDCPLFIPLIVNNRDKLRNYLIQKNIYCPIHWPITKFHNINKKTKDIYEKEISIICDQRYTENEIKYMCEIIKKGLEGC